VKDDEARYLIDQFNKYASWGVSQHATLDFYFSAAIISSYVLIVAILSTASFSDPSNPFRFWTGLIFLVAVGINGGVLFYHTHQTKSKLEENGTKLILLEEYRFTHRNYPDGALPWNFTLETIVQPLEKWEPREEWKKLLATYTK